MKKSENRTFIKLGITGVVVAMIALTGWFLMSHAAGIGSFFGGIMKILMPFIYGAVIAYLLSPLCGCIEAFLRRFFPRAKGWPAGISILLSLLFALFVIVLLLILVIPNLVQSVVQIVQAIPAQIRSASAWLHNVLETYPDLQDSWDEYSASLIANVTSWLQTDLLTTVETLVGSLSVKVIGAANLVKNVFLGILISAYLLASRRKFARQGRMLLAGIFPKKAADLIEEELRYADRMFNGFLMGRVIDSVVIGIICFVVTMIFRFDSAVLVSVIVGVTNIIPVFGPFLGAIPCALILLLENPLHCVIFLIFIVILQQIDGNIIGPRILGQTTGVSSFWVLFSVMFFGGLWGILGMIIGVPVFAVIYDIIRKLSYLGLHRHGREDLLAPREAADTADAAQVQERESM